MVDFVTGAGILLALFVGTTIVRRRTLEGMEFSLLRRIGLVSGVAAPTVSIGGIAVAAVLAPSFSVTRHSISDLGVAPGLAAPIFNTAMVVTGLVALPFGVAIVVEGTNWERLSVVALAVAMNGLNFIGVFQKGEFLHLVGGLGFYSSFTVAFLLYAHGTRDERAACVTRRLAGVHVAVWALWGLGVAIVQPSGNPFFAPGALVPQFAGAVILAGWTVWIAWRRFGGDAGFSESRRELSLGDGE